MSIIKRDFLRKTLFALGAAAAIGGATVSTGYAEAVSGFETDWVASPASTTYPAVATNPGGPGLAANSFNSGAAKTPAGAKTAPAMDDASAEVDPWKPDYADN